MSTATQYTSVEDYVRKRYAAIGKTGTGLLITKAKFARLLKAETASSLFARKTLEKAITDLWPQMHPKLSTPSEIDLFIKSVFAEYGWKGDPPVYQGSLYLNNVIGTAYFHDLKRNGDKILQTILKVRIDELRPFLQSGRILEKGFKPPPSSNANTGAGKAVPTGTQQTSNAHTSSSTSPPIAPSSTVAAPITPVKSSNQSAAQSTSSPANQTALPSASTSSHLIAAQTNPKEWGRQSTIPTPTKSVDSAIPRSLTFKLGLATDSSGETTTASKGIQNADVLDGQWGLMEALVEQNEHVKNDGEEDIHHSAYSRAICFSPAVLSKAEEKEPITQYGLLGTRIPSLSSNNSKENNLVMTNGNHPTSFFICGLQGQGKSHTLSCLLENFLLPSPMLGKLHNPLSALVLHYDSFSSSQAFRPSEAVFLSNPSVAFKAHAAYLQSVNVLVSESNYYAMKRAYEIIPNVHVRPLKLNPKHLTAGTLQTLMAVSTTEKPTLYMAQVLQLLRDMAAESPDFDYTVFRKRLSSLKLERIQEVMLTQRLALLDSFLDLTTDPAEQLPLISDKPGSLTVIDLSCPFVGEDTACIIFHICIELFLASDTGASGKVIAVDEAHKYMTSTPSAKELTKQLLGIVRLQRHYGVRVIIATQEPTIDPMLIDLSSVKIVHRFTSPDWFQYLGKHLPVTKGGQEELWDWICKLRTGQAVVFDPSAVLMAEEGDDKFGCLLKEAEGWGDGASEWRKERQSKLVAMVNRCWRIKIRNRLTMDGGKSMVAV